MKQLLHKNIRSGRMLLLVFACILLCAISRAQAPANDLCAGAIPINSVITPCGAGGVAGTMVNATLTAGVPVGCGTPAYDVWYTFVAKSVNPTITLSGIGASFLTPRIQVLTGAACGGFASVSCGATPLITAGLTAGVTYYVRVFSNTGPAPLAAGGFTICITDPAPPANDLCTGATLLATGVLCGAPTAGNLHNSTATAGIPGDCGAANSWEVWYRFVPTTIYPTITLSTLGANFTAAGPRIQLLSGACGSQTSLACVSGLVMNTQTAVGGAGLTVGATYYIRVYHNSTTMSGAAAAWSFNICVTEMTAAATANPTVDYGKSYINITKQTSGGTVEPGDVLEIRATFVVKTNTAYGVRFSDVVPANTSYVGGTLRILTNEGKIYKQWTDATDGDAARISGSNIWIGYGQYATETAGGEVGSTDRPTNFGSTCIMMASYRVTVTGGYGGIIPVGGGSLAYTRGNGGTTVVAFPVVNAMIYQNSGICTNTVGTNAIISESGGTFGSGNTKDRVASNKVPANYVYAIFAPANPQDYFYGVSNNTSAGTAVANYSINPNDAVGAHRVFSKWDIMGDHTGAAVPTAGNLPANTNGGQSGGYMVVINAAYKTDTAFLDTISNLCPNTYYEYSAWFKNVCRLCGNDSTGKSPGTAGYLPTALGDSSGVRPTLTFNVNGYDYYSSGDIIYTNLWIKKGFTYKTGPAETQMIINIRNNAPGGGGNDWAIDDIGVATCSPNLDVNPAAPVINVCFGDGLSLSAQVRSYFNNYTHYVWERSTDNGATWSNTAFSGSGVVPVFNGTEYEYTATGPSIIGDSTTAGNRFRLRVASTASNLSDPNCSFLASRTVQVLVENCSYVLTSDLVSATGTLQNNLAAIEWKTVNENANVNYEVEKSLDGVHYNVINKVQAHAITGTATYNFNDPAQLTTLAWYRIKLIDGARFKYSKVIVLSPTTINYEVKAVVSPFINEVKFQALIPADGVLTIVVTDNFGRRMKTSVQKVSRGSNNIVVAGMAGVAPGIYAMQAEYNGKTIVKRILKVTK